MLAFSIHFASLPFIELYHATHSALLFAIHVWIAHYRGAKHILLPLVLGTKHLASHKQFLLIFRSTLTVPPNMPSKPCPYCPIKFAKQSVLETHIKHVHPTNVAVKTENFEDESPKAVIRVRSQERGMESQSRGVNYPPVVRSASLGFKVLLPLMRREFGDRERLILCCSKYSY